MGPSNIRDLLTTFSPSLDFFAISSGDGRIKIWDTLKGQVQTEFADIISTDTTNLCSKPERGHLSVDYTCLKWLSLDSKKKRKLRCSLLVLGTGSGDVLALDVSAGELKWRIGDCHPGGVSAISCSTDGSCIYAAGADGMISKIDSSVGNLLGKFRASTKAISSMSVSSDGKVLATAAAQLKIFNSSDHKKIQKFSGHPGAVRCMIFTDDGEYILSSAIGERYIAVWRIDGSKKQSASCVLAMEHPAVFLDSRCIDNGDTDKSGLYVLAISEIGVCYFWYAKNMEDLRNTKPTKVSVSLEDNFSKNHKGLPTIFAAKLQGVVKPASGDVFVAYGSLVKPSFQKVIVHSGTDIKINISQDGILLPMDQSHKSKKGLGVKDGVTALDRANAEEALLPIPKIFYFHDKNKRYQNSNIDPDEIMADDLMNVRSQNKAVESKDDLESVEASNETSCLEEQLRSLGLLDNKDDLTSNSMLNSTKFKGISIEENMPPKKMRAAVSSIIPGDAYELLKVLVTMWQSRSCSGNYVLPWIYTILVNHSQHIVSLEPMTQLLDFLHQSTKSRGTAVQSLLQLSGGLQLVMAQIDKASQNISQIQHGHQVDESEDEDEDEEVEDVLYGEEDDESQISSDNDD
ncbi:WD repeat-containing protein 43 isoform X2 [Vitis riparia]|uniref:WD repeat-containing protein 43 isoform X2 n=1 Tax=Vitis riparia TaxID=96939 RepID=UPI00155B23A4|nr:WD repeat-containing protein 43 isoform X2 [Vitis riparia]